MKLPQRLFNLIQHENFSLRPGDASGDILVSWKLAEAKKLPSGEILYTLTEAGKNSQKSGYFTRPLAETPEKEKKTLADLVKKDKETEDAG